MRKVSANPLSLFALNPIRPMLRKRENYIIPTLVLLYATFLYVFHLPCPFQGILHIPCPGCGMTRALMSACRLDFMAAFSYHRMFWSVPLLLFYMLYDGAPFRSRLLNRTLLVGLSIGFLLNWILNIAAL